VASLGPGIGDEGDIPEEVLKGTSGRHPVEVRPRRWETAKGGDVGGNEPYLEGSLILLRHAHAEWSLDEMRPLSVQGWEAAKKLGNVIGPLGIDRILSSPSPRAIQTVLPLASRRRLRIRLDEGLRERTVGFGWLPDFEEVMRKSWEDFEFSLPGGETNRSAQLRIVEAVSRACSQCPLSTTVLSTHGNVLALFLNALDPLVGFPFWQQLRMPDAYFLEIGSGGELAHRRLG
jgi:2,3-bisphosphoglycerate-dependent phosphoglycerate mutase